MPEWVNDELIIHLKIVQKSILSMPPIDYCQFPTVPVYLKQWWIANRGYYPAKAKLKTFTHFIENNRQHIFFLVIFFGITFALFAERFYCRLMYIVYTLFILNIF